MSPDLAHCVICFWNIWNPRYGNCDTCHTGVAAPEYLWKDAQYLISAGLMALCGCHRGLAISIQSSGSQMVVFTRLHQSEDSIEIEGPMRSQYSVFAIPVIHHLHPPVGAVRQLAWYLVLRWMQWKLHCVWQFSQEILQCFETELTANATT